MFEKGREKTGGRKPGVKNKTTEEIRQAIQLVLSDKVDVLAEDLQAMSEFKQWQILNAVARYVLPALSKAEDKVEHSGEVNIVVTYEDTPTGDNGEKDPF
ncbi:hypothetical protein [Mucilaginibacter psychrotolerans]|uniref:Uncharacterized protein n=1 Tax=Mucilaginibacter psychrotolerans TaxID=1524096 RepID=A0A4Y8S751_9SPHI|nr:hypothetical protein [Mucilaginibacter psychrotolerans]TFF34400.1 hypothetical protein E2R66_22255 [Mucilaginibacter psychrotolerans]